MIFVLLSSTQELAVTNKQGDRGDRPAGVKAYQVLCCILHMGHSGRQHVSVLTITI